MKGASAGRYVKIRSISRDMTLHFQWGLPVGGRLANVCALPASERKSKKNCEGRAHPWICRSILDNYRAWLLMGFGITLVASSRTAILYLRRRGG